MHIKKFIGKTIVEALAKVKKEFGDSAVILNSEKVKINNEYFYEITAAIDKQEEITLKANNVNKKINELCEYEEEKLSLYNKGQKELEELRKDILEIKKILLQTFSNEIKNKEYIKLLEKGVPKFIAKEIVSQEKSIKEFIEERLEEKGIVPNSKYQVFLGEAGSGKTSAIFKLATWYRYNKEAKVIVINLDTYNIGRNYQAERMAQFLEIDLETMDIENLVKILPALKSYDYVLIDTPGLGKRFGLNEIDILKENNSVNFLWVVKGTDHYSLAFNTWQYLEKFPIYAIFLTFTDRILTGYSILWLLDRRFPSINFISTGERIPEDIERAEKDLLLRLFLKGIEK